MKPISFAGRSVLECLLAAKRSIKLRHRDPNDDADWTDELKAVDIAVDILSRPTCTVSTVAVNEDVVATWEAALADRSTQDVIIRVLPCSSSASGSHPIGKGERTSGRSGSGSDKEEQAEGTAISDLVEVTEVHAHSTVLRGASSVLKAMLSTQGMREGAQRIIEVTGSSARAVSLVLGLVYTGAVPAGCGDEDEQDLSMATILSALDLAHRWQLLHVVQMLAAAAAKRINSESFEAAMDTALRLELPALLAASRSFAGAHPRDMRTRLAYQRGNASAIQSVAVRADVERLLACEGSSSADALSSSSASSSKRKRKLL